MLHRKDAPLGSIPSYRPYPSSFLERSEGREEGREENPPFLGFAREVGWIGLKSVTLGSHGCNGYGGIIYFIGRTFSDDCHRQWF
jgi:hypothetical protein